MTDWPASIPIPGTVDRQSYRERPDTNRASFQTAVGPEKVRRRSTLNGSRISFALWLDGDQVDTFETFYRTTLKDGTLPFQMVHPRTGVEGTFRFDTSSEPETSEISSNVFQISVDLRKVA